MLSAGNWVLTLHPVAALPAPNLTASVLAVAPRNNNSVFRGETAFAADCIPPTYTPPAYTYSVYIDLYFWLHAKSATMGIIHQRRPRRIHGANDSALMQSGIFEFIIGKDRRRFSIHVALASSFLKDILQLPMNSEIDEVVFGRCCEFVYSGDYSVPFLISNPSGSAVDQPSNSNTVSQRFETR